MNLPETRLGRATDAAGERLQIRPWSEGVLVRDRGQEHWRIRWADIEQIAAWKDDVFAFDVICVGFRVARTDPPSWFTCDEEMTGFGTLVEDLISVFGVEGSWLSDVAAPAFEENFTLLWDRRDGPPYPPETKG